MMPIDPIDEMNAIWREVRPDLDPSPLDVVGRILVLARRLEHSVEIALKPHGLSLGQFDILATLRRGGDGARRTPTALLKSVMLSSGGMTNRLDRLESAGLLFREPDPDDRRGIVVGLTAEGRTRIDAAIATRFAEARTSLPDLTPTQLDALADYLRFWLAGRSES